MAMTEIKKILMPVIQKIEKDYKPLDIAKTMMALAFEILVKQQPDYNKSRNTYTALADNIARMNNVKRA